MEADLDLGAHPRQKLSQLNLRTEI